MSSQYHRTIYERRVKEFLGQRDDQERAAAARNVTLEDNATGLASQFAVFDRDLVSIGEIEPSDGGHETEFTGRVLGKRKNIDYDDTTKFQRNFDPPEEEYFDEVDEDYADEAEEEGEDDDEEEEGDGEEEEGSERDSQTLPHEKALIHMLTKQLELQRTGDERDFNNNVLVNDATAEALPSPDEFRENKLILAQMLEGFDIVAKSMERLKAIEDDVLPEDMDEPLYDGAPFKKGEFAQAVAQFLALNNLGPQAEHQLLVGILFKYFGPARVNLPLRLTASKTVRASTQDYIPFRDRDLFAPVCPRSCCVLVGPFMARDTCPVCQSECYTHCKNPGCRLKPYNTCACPLEGRTPKKRIHYKPIIPLLVMLVKMPAFRAAISYRYVRPDKSRIYDIMQGREARKQRKEMQSQFETKYPGGSCPRTGKTVRSCPLTGKTVKPALLLLGEFYDGAKVFTKAYKVFWPLFMSILNLPPTYRNRTGVGMFLVAVFTAKLGSPAEEFIFEGCLIPELRRLNEGIEVDIGGNELVYLQARMVQHLCDGRAQEKMFHVQAAGSLFGCTLCQGITGISRKAEMDRVTYIGHRAMLPYDNHLR